MMYPLRWIIPLWLCLTYPALLAQAQSYAPPTEYHDPVQRVFVVETARVLAWWMDPASTNLAQVKYETTTKPDGGTVWELRWLDPKGKTAKSATISYGADLLQSGPDFYRKIFEELWLKDWKNPPALDAKETIEAYWRGATEMGLSRESSLQAAESLLRQSGKAPERVWIPELAGMLAHAALQHYAASTTLDTMLLARGAAWLAFIEHMCSARLDPLWTPVLFQAGRETTAARIWQATVPAKLEKATPQQKGWNLWVRKASSKEIFLFATEPANLTMALPMLVYDARVNSTGDILGELVGPLAESTKTLAALHNYAPFFARHTSIGGGRILEGSWAVFDRLAWMECLSRFSPTPLDYAGYAQTLQEATNTVAKALKPREDTDPSLMGLREIAPLLNLAHTEGAGNLIPTPAVTARDLLNYGWEETGWQMGARYSFVQYSWGVPELADPIYRTVTATVEGLMPFFRRERDSHIQNYRSCLERLQLVSGLANLVGLSTPPTDSAQETLEGVRLFVKRAWLRPLEFDWQARELWSMEGIADIPNLIRSLHEEGGTLGTVEVLGYLTAINRESLRRLPGGPDLKTSLGESLPQTTALKIKAVFDEKLRNMNNVDRAMEYERLYWQNPDAGLESKVIYNYLVSGSYKAARRFYSQVRPNLRDPVLFSNGLGLELFVAGICLDDAELRKHVLEDSDCGSYNDMMMQVWDAALRDRPKQMESTVNEMIERYESTKGENAQAKQLQRFLPLLPALRNPAHPSHRDALEYFGKDGGWTVLRFIWIQKFKMSLTDAITFLGGRENTSLNRMIIASLEKDQPKALQELNELNGRGKARNEYLVLATCLYGRLHPLSPPHEEPDLKPAGATTVRQAVVEQLKKSGRWREQ